jgi:predicted DNA-binding protein
MITLPEHLEKQLINLANRKNATTDTIIEWALKSLEFDLDDAEMAEKIISDIESGKEKVLTLNEFNKALEDGLDG